MHWKLALIGMSLVGWGLADAQIQPAMAAPAASAASQPSAGAPPISLDDVTVEQLAALDHVDASLATSIVAMRTSRGGHVGNVEELRAIPGMTQPALDTLRERTGILLTVGGGTGKTYSTVAEVLGEFAGEPTVQQVQDWSSAYARANPELVRSWNAASRGFAALPQLTLEYRLREDWDRDFKYEDGGGGGLEASPTSIDEGQQYQILVRSRWELSELVMSSERIRVINESQDAVKLRDKLLTQVTRLYFDRRRHQVEMLLNPRPSLEGQVEDELRLLELAAGIDALTGGEFSKAVRTK
ncbi:MAG: ComEA family DNA-binding protein [Myxococcota bacterium]